MSAESETSFCKTEEKVLIEATAASLVANSYDFGLAALAIEMIVGLRSVRSRLGEES